MHRLLPAPSGGYLRLPEEAAAIAPVPGAVTAPGFIPLGSRDIPAWARRVVRARPRLGLGLASAGLYSAYTGFKLAIKHPGLQINMVIV